MRDSVSERGEERLEDSLNRGAKKYSRPLVATHLGSSKSLLFRLSSTGAVILIRSSERALFELQDGNTRQSASEVLLQI